MRLEVERAAFRDVVRDVGDMDAQPEVAVLNRSIEIASSKSRVLAVDRDRRPAAEIGALLNVTLPDLQSRAAAPRRSRPGEWVSGFACG
jgi:hypothetical protein